MKTKFLHIVLLLCAWLVMGDVHARDPRAFGLRLSQQVTGETSPHSVPAAEMVPINFGNSDMGKTSRELKALTLNNPILLPVQAYGDGVYTSSEIISSAQSIMSPAMARQIGDRLKALMKTNIAGSAVYSFEQNVTVRFVDRVTTKKKRRFFFRLFKRYSTTTQDIITKRPMKLVWVVTASDSGGVIAGVPELVNVMPSMLRVTYFPLANDPAFNDQSFNREFAGYMTYQLMDKNIDSSTGAVSYSPASQEVDIDLNGLFDPDAEYTDAGLHCMVNASRPGCEGRRLPYFSEPGMPSHLDVVGLMRDLNADEAEIHYYRPIAPAMSEVTLSDGSVIYDDRLDVYYQRRELMPTGCDTFVMTNDGKYQFVIDDILDIYVMKKGDQAATFVKREVETIPTEEIIFHHSGTISEPGFSLKDVVFRANDFPKLDWTWDTHGLRELAKLEIVYPQLGLPAISPVSGGQIFSNGEDHLINTSADGLRVGSHTSTVQFNIADKRMWHNFVLSNFKHDAHARVAINGWPFYFGPHQGKSLEAGMFCEMYQPPCSDGWSAKNGVCVESRYSCNEGDVLSGDICIVEDSYAPLATKDSQGINTYSCKDNDVLKNETCWSYTTYGALHATKPLPDLVQVCTPSALYDRERHFLFNNGGYASGLNLLPFLQDGVNTINIQTVVAGGTVGATGGYSLAIAGKSCRVADSAALK